MTLEIKGPFVLALLAAFVMANSASADPPVPEPTIVFVNALGEEVAE